jgi:serine/threonine protein phosphatase 1
MALIKKLPKDTPIVMLGDLVDRGPRNRDVINWVRSNNIPCVVGNHEVLMASPHFSERQVWMMNGGRQTTKEYETKPLLDRDFSKFLNGHEEYGFDSEAFNNDVAWINSLPWYIEFKDIKNQAGRYLVVSHTTVADIWSKKDYINKEDTVWERRNMPPQIKGAFNIFGHTPVSKPLIRDHFANIDTGCVYGSSYNLGHLTALQYPEMIIYQQKCIDFDLA